VLLIVFTGWQVFGRYVLNDTPTWTEKLALLLILIVSLPMAAVGLRENFHLGISMFADKLAPRARRWLEMLNALILAGFGLAMIVYSRTLVVGTWGRDIPLLGLPQGLQYLPLMICGGLIVLFMIERLWFLWRAPAADGVAALEGIAAPVSPTSVPPGDDDRIGPA